MTTVYFIRHAQPNYSNHCDEQRELTAKGMEDRKLVTRFLADKNVDMVLSSHFLRAVDTIRHFAEENDLPITLIDGFRERRVDSVWIEDFMDFAQKQWEDFDYKLSDGECLAEVQKRQIAALSDVLTRYEGKNIIVGSHGTAISTIIHYYVPGFGFEDFLEIRPKMPHIVEFQFDGQHCVRIRQHDLFPAP